VGLFYELALSEEEKKRKVERLGKDGVREKGGKGKRERFRSKGGKRRGRKKKIISEKNNG